MSHEHQHVEEKTLANDILHNCEVSAQRCYQCGKCSAGCPVADEMDYPPSVVMRMLQTADSQMEEKLLTSNSIWLCVTCEMCYQRCPMEIDIPKVMDYMRQVALKQHKVNPKSNGIVSFHKAFLDSIQHTGRLYEIGLIADYKMRTFNLTQDVMLAPVMFAKGKLAIIPEMIKERKLLNRIFKKTLNKEE